MPMTLVNLAKNTITPSSNRKGGYAFWDDSIATWDDATYFWDSPLIRFNTNLAKNTITPTNLPKN